MSGEGCDVTGRPHPQHTRDGRLSQGHNYIIIQIHSTLVVVGCRRVITIIYVMKSQVSDD